jgi:hypothetical protein
MGEFRLLYLLCMLRFPVPLHSLHVHITALQWNESQTHQDADVL